MRFEYVAPLYSGKNQENTHTHTPKKKKRENPCYELIYREANSPLFGKIGCGKFKSIGKVVRVRHMHMHMHAQMEKEEDGALYLLTMWAQWEWQRHGAHWATLSFIFNRES